MVCEGEGKVCEGDGIVCEGEGMVCEGEGMVCEGKVLVCEGIIENTRNYACHNSSKDHYKKCIPMIKNIYLFHLVLLCGKYLQFTLLFSS